jgi:hypothetical protein
MSAIAPTLVLYFDHEATGSLRAFPYALGPYLLLQWPIFAAYCVVLTVILARAKHFNA